METQAIAKAGGAQPVVKPAAEKTYFSGAKSLTDFLRKVDDHGPFKGTAKEYSPEEIKEILGEVLRKEKDVNYITRTDGLRDAFSELLEGFKPVTTEISRQEGLEILRRAEIHGEPFNGRDLTIEMLEREGLEPRHRIKIGDASIWFSSCPYQLDGNRIAVVGYVETDDKKVVARSYYRSNSAGRWRYLPAYVPDERGGIDWYAKGHAEESITGPAQTQMALDWMTMDRAMPVKRVRDPDLVFAGTARNMENPERMKTYLGEVSEHPKDLFIPAVKIMEGNLHSTVHKKIPPEQVKPANSEDEADFSKYIMNWKGNTNIQGPINIDVFESRNGEYLYMFCKDMRGRIWPLVEDTSPIKSVGLRTNWVWAGDLATPVDEYESQAGGYGNPYLRNGPYVDMYQNYISKIPMVQDYAAWRAQRDAWENRTIIQRA